MTFLIDTSVLVRLLDHSSPMNGVAKQAIENSLGQGNEPYLCSQNLIEIWNVATRPLEKNGLGWTVAQTFHQVQALQQGFTVLQNSGAVFARWLSLVNHYGVQGKQVHDAHIAAFAIENALDGILTFNTGDFQRFAAELSILHPKDMVSHETVS